MLVFANAPASTRDFALHQAVLDDDKQLVTQLLNKGAAIDVIGSRRYGYGSALHLAVREGHLRIAKLLLDRGAQVDVLDPDDFTPLHNAAWNGNLEMTELLLDAGADIEASTYDGDTPLSLAQNNDQAQVAEFIQAKLQPSATSETKVESTSVSDSGVIDISGTYIADLSGHMPLLRSLVSRPKSKDRLGVTIVQNGNQITVTYDDGRGKMWGTIEGDTVMIEWIGHGGDMGNGKWTFNPGSNELSGNFDSGRYVNVPGQINLTKVESTPVSDTGVIDISGTYVSEITAESQRSPFFWRTKTEYKNIEVKLIQNGNEITGSFGGSRGLIWGRIEGDTIFFDWDVSGEGNGKGKWTIKPGGNEITGHWFHTFRGSGKWNLTKIESDTAPIPDISGTYIAETTGSAIVQAGPAVKFVKNMNGKLIVLKQTGNTITGSVGSQSNWIKGTREGNIINFYIIADNDIVGSWEINADASHLEGKWHSDDGFAPSGKWNLTKIE
jgi:hypothetical protein